MSKKYHNVFAQLQDFESHIVALEDRILELERRIEEMLSIERNHLMRVKNHEEISDEFIQNGKKYQDLSPERAFKLYSDRNYDFILIDVSARDYRPLKPLPEAIHMPWEDFDLHFMEIQSRSIPILVISEDGTNSILACEYLSRRGYYNCNNISGGYKHWKGFDEEAGKNLSA